jgi:dTDP-4-amino-4,6-dideoxygalactose transaminase
MGSIRKFKKFNSFDELETSAVLDVLASGVLSKFLGEQGSDFNGGPNILAMEKSFSNYFGVEHAISFNSWTSGLIAAIGSLDIEPGDEVIVSPWTMSASATSILHWNAIPIFADIDSETYCLDLDSVESKINSRTKAIMNVDIFGQSGNVEGLMSLGEKYGLKIISDTAQAPGALRHGKKAGTLGDLGGFSLNYHKHIHCGEGGVLVTDNSSLAERARLIRNHAESVIEGNSAKNLSNMLGHNFRMNEIEAAIANVQLKKLDSIVHERQSQAMALTQRLSHLPGLRTPKVDRGNSHVYYMYAMQIDPDLGIDKFTLVAKLAEFGIPNISTSYRNLHLLPLFQKKIAYGKEGYPWTSSRARKNISYLKGICPKAEELQDRTYFGFYINEFDLAVSDVDFIGEMFQKTWKYFGLN